MRSLPSALYLYVTSFPQRPFPVVEVVRWLQQLDALTIFLWLLFGFMSFVLWDFVLLFLDVIGVLKVFTFIQQSFIGRTVSTICFYPRMVRKWQKDREFRDMPTLAAPSPDVSMQARPLSVGAGNGVPDFSTPSGAGALPEASYSTPFPAYWLTLDSTVSLILLSEAKGEKCST
jgi:hypothetical protein